MGMFWRNPTVPRRKTVKATPPVGLAMLDRTVVSLSVSMSTRRGIEGQSDLRMIPNTTRSARSLRANSLAATLRIQRRCRFGLHRGVLYAESNRVQCRDPLAQSVEHLPLGR